MQYRCNHTAPGSLEEALKSLLNFSISRLQDGSEPVTQAAISVGHSATHWQERTPDLLDILWEIFRYSKHSFNLWIEGSTALSLPKIIARRKHTCHLSSWTFAWLAGRLPP
jgi:hypothetical protein